MKNNTDDIPLKPKTPTINFRYLKYPDVILMPKKQCRISFTVKEDKAMVNTTIQQLNTKLEATTLPKLKKEVLKTIKKAWDNPNALQEKEKTWIVESFRPIPPDTVITMV